MIKKENFFTVQGFMITDLQLKGNELLIYAIIYGFSQTEGQYFTGSLKYLSEWTNLTTRNVINLLQKLVQKNLIIKEEEHYNGVKLCKYKTNFEKFSSPVKNFHGGDEKFSCGVMKNFHEGDEKNSHNNINNNINNNIDNNIETSGAVAPVCVEKIQKQNCNSLIMAIENDGLRNAYLEYVKMRKLIKKPLTFYSLKLLINKVTRLAKSDSEQIELLNEATLHNWQSVYPLRKDPFDECNRNFNVQLKKSTASETYNDRVRHFLQANN